MGMGNIILSPRGEAVRSLVRIQRESAYSNLLTREVLARNDWSSADRGLYLTLVYGTLQNMGWIDHLLSKVIDRPLGQVNLGVLMILRTAVYQLIFLDRVPDYAVVDEAVGCAGRFKKQAKGFVNGVLRQFITRQDQLTAFDLDQWFNEKEGLALRYSLPQRMVFQFFEAFGDEKAMTIIPLQTETAPLSIRVNTLKTTREQMMAELASEGYQCVLGKMVPECIHVTSLGSGGDLSKDSRYLNGAFTIQDQGAMVLARMLDPQPGECILDMCAAPGGKTTHLAQLMRDEGMIFARDVHPHRVKLIEAAAQRMGMNCIIPQVMDGTQLDPMDLGYFDRILLDAPCSGTGILRRKPELKSRNGKRERQVLRQIQAALLENAVMMLKPGGKLLYATCSLDREENTNQIMRLVQHHPEMRVISETMGYTDPTIDGCDVFFHCALVKK